MILLVLYFIIVWLLSSLRLLHREPETKVKLRTEALTQEMTERARLDYRNVSFHHPLLESVSWEETNEQK